MEIMNMARARLKKYRDLTIAVQLPSVFQGQTNYDVQFYLQGPDLDKLERLRAAGETACGAGARRRGSRFLV